MIEQLIKEEIEDHLNNISDAYAIALIQGQECNYLGYAIATYNGLFDVVNEYVKLGYKYDGAALSDSDALKIMLKWSNPDDGWSYFDFSDQSLVNSYLQSFNFDVEKLRSDLIEKVKKVIKYLPQPVLFGISEGSDPENFKNSVELIYKKDQISQFLSEFDAMQKIERKISRSKRS